VALAAAFSAAFSSAVGSAPGAQPRNGGTLRIASVLDVDTLDPALATSALTWALEYGTCSTLTTFRDTSGPRGYTIRPEAAAHAPEISRDGRTYVFTLRKGLRFSDGSPITAANFAVALGRVLNPAMRSYGAILFSDVTRVTGHGLRLRIQLSTRSGDLLTRLALPFACPVPRGYPVNPAGVPLTVGSGPYYVAERVAGKSLVLERNRYYSGPRSHRIGRLVMTIAADVDDAIQAVEDGRADVLGAEVPFERRDELARRYGIDKGRLFRIRGTVIYFLALNTSRPLFHDVALRKAVNYALDRGAIIRRGPGWPLSHTATDQIVPRWVPGWKDRRLYPLARPNLTRARSLAAGHVPGKAILYTSQVPFLVDQANAIARNLREIDLDVDVRALAPAVLDAKAGRPGEPYDLLLTRYFVEYPDPANVIVRLLAGQNARRPAGNTNLAYFDSPVYNRRMTAADRLSGTQRLNAFSRVEADLMRDAAPMAPLYEGVHWVFVSKRVGCFRLNPVRVTWWDMCLR
jgi:peptide/nickel transport system substrate-binding protein